MYSGKSGCIRVKTLKFGQKLFYSVEVVVFGQKWLYSDKKVFSGKLVVLGGKS